MLQPSSSQPSLTHDTSSPASSLPLTPCRSQRQQQRTTFLTASSDSDDDSSDEEMLTPSKPPASGKIVILGTVTPSRAFRIFATSRRPLASQDDDDAHSAKRRRTVSHRDDAADLTLRSSSVQVGDDDSLMVGTTAAATLTAPLATRRLGTARDVGAALLARRSGLVRGGSATLSRVSQASYHQRFEPSPALALPSLHDAQPSHPLCAAYAFAARSAGAASARQWLAVGTNDGAVILCDTARLAAASQLNPDECNAAAELDASERIAWGACKGSVFDLAWRADDRALVTGGSDYLVRTWDTATLQETGAFGAHRGSPRAVTWDPTHASGSLFVSAGRDGAIHLFDTRTSSGRDAATPAVLSIWGAHTTLPPRPARGPGSRGGRAGAPPIVPKGVTTLTYVPSRGPHVLASAGCADGRVKLWDLRALSGHEAPIEAELPAGQKKPKRRAKKQGAAGGENDPIEIEPVDESSDVTQGNDGWNQSSHGISSIVAGSHTLFASSTDGRIYSMPLSDLTEPALTPLGVPSPFHDPTQSGNTLYARLALHDDERTLALGCNSGTITLWDTWAAARTPDYQPAILAGAHANNREINAVSWSHGLHGPTLASVSDDYSLRFWRALNA